ncbi:MAG: hypothetical protein J6P95_02815, partial [Paludibacteraceae bacterium]|nr:hypothetical protein [Paludibacteraceae bacterium]
YETLYVRTNLPLSDIMQLTGLKRTDEIYPKIVGKIRREHCNADKRYLVIPESDTNVVIESVFNLGVLLRFSTENEV